MFAYARTRLGETLRSPEFSRHDTGGRQVTYHGARFDQVAGPTQVVIGLVTDADTGRPLAGAIIQCSTALGNPLGFVQTRADDQGRYRLTGLSMEKDSLGNDNNIVVRLPGREPYPSFKKGVGRGLNLKTVTIDVANEARRLDHRPGLRHGHRRADQGGP